MEADADVEADADEACVDTDVADTTDADIADTDIADADADANNAYVRKAICLGKREKIKQ